MKRSEVIFSIRLLLGGPHHGCVKPEAGREEGMATDLATVLMAIDRKDAGGPAEVGADEQPGRGDRLVRYPEQARVDVGRAGRDHS